MEGISLAEYKLVVGLSIDFHPQKGVKIFKGKEAASTIMSFIDSGIVVCLLHYLHFVICILGMKWDGMCFQLHAPEFEFNGS